MKARLVTIAVTLIFSVLTFLIVLEIIAQQRQLECDHHEVFHSEILKEERELLIHLPKSYDSTRQYHVIYVLDGTSQDHTVFNITEIMGNAGIIENVIVVGIPNTDRNRDLTPPYIRQELESDEMGQADAFLDFIKNEVMPLVESKYNIQQNSLFGYSRGGLFTFYTFLNSPNLFDAYFSISPALWRDDSEIIKRTSDILKISSDHSSFLFISLGENENNKMRTSFDQLSLLLDSLYPKKSFHTLISDADHSNNVYQSTPLAIMKWEAWRKN